MKIKITKEGALKASKALCVAFANVLFDTAADALYSKLETNRRTGRRYFVDVVGGDVTYGDAISAIMNSDMMSCHMREAAEAVPRGEDSGFYQGIIAATKGSAMSCHKRDLIENICKK